MSNSRSKNVLNNIVVGLACQFITLLLSFISRTIFINTLGIEYLGLNGLFSNVLMVLSFAELGIGNAIIFSLYSPLSRKDNGKISALMLLYKQTYTALGVIIITIGVIIIPVMPYLISSPPNIPENINLLYVLFLLNTGVSYFGVYKKSIFIADQKNYLILIINQGLNIVHFCVNVGILYTTRNFVLYLIINIAFTILDNILAMMMANKHYPYLHDETNPLDKEEKKQIADNVKSLAIYKFGSVIVNGTDNIIISSLVGVAEVGLVSNYTLVTNACNAILAKIEESFMASIGNLNVDSSSTKKKDVFDKIFLISFWIYGLTTCGLALLFNDFIKIWIGEEYCLDQIVIIAICLELYVSGMQNPAYMFRTTLGLFKQGKVSALLASIMNIVLSLLLFKMVGLSGIFFATSVSKFFSYGIVDPILIYKKAFDEKAYLYYIKYFTYFALAITIYVVSSKMLLIVSVEGVFGFVIKIILVGLLFNIVILGVFCRNRIFIDLIKQIRYVFKR